MLFRSIDPADEVAYNTADLDDAWSAGLIAARDVAEAVPQYREIHEAVETQFPGATERERFHEALRQLVDLLVSGLIEGTVAAVEASGAAGFEDVRAHPVRLARFTAQAGETSRALKRFLYTRVYASDALGSDRQLSMTRIAELFRFFLASPDRLPQPYAQQALDTPAHRVVCDYIAGMTDGFFHRTYESMLGPTANPPLS